MFLIKEPKDIELIKLINQIWDTTQKKRALRFPSLTFTEGIQTSNKIYDELLAAFAAQLIDFKSMEIPRD